MSCERGRSDDKANDGRILVLGGGGREHVIAWKLCQSKGVTHIWVSPGNGGTELLAKSLENKIEMRNVLLQNNQQIVQFVQDNHIGLVVVGPEQPLADGIGDELEQANVRCFGPRRAGARIEFDKVYAKSFMMRNGIATAEYGAFERSDLALAYVDEMYGMGKRVVVKAAGLAAGKGVILPRDRQEARQAVLRIMVDRIFGEAGREVVIEQYIEGEELSVFALMDGEAFVVMPAVRDHKRLFEGNRGPNTGGMGAYSSVDLLGDGELKNRVENEIFAPAMRGFCREGVLYVGVLFAGLMLTEDGGIYCLEFNCRFGDPETLALLPLMKSDFLSVIRWCVNGELTGKPIEYNEHMHAVSVVLASEGYPESPKTKRRVTLDVSPIPLLRPYTRRICSNSAVFHAGTRIGDGGDVSGLISCGGRVLVVNGYGATVEEAICYAYSRCELVGFEGSQRRLDVGIRAKARSLRIAVLGSGRGSSFQPLLDRYCEGGFVGLELVVVASNVKDAYILKRASDCGVTTRWISGRRRVDFETNLLDELESLGGVDLVVLVGFMRILSPLFVQKFCGRIINVHPSLLPAYSGLMDLEVHRQVIEAGDIETGCTVHVVEEQVDSGPILVQKRCPVLEGDTPDALKARVQALEAPALFEAIMMYCHGIVPVESILGRGATYLESGVDIEGAEVFVDRIGSLCKATARFGALDVNLGGFGSLFSLDGLGYNRPVFVSSTDGVGTKLLLAIEHGMHDSVGQDLVAMCVNDVLCQGAEPLFFLDYLACGKLDIHEAVSILSGIATACKECGCALIGGETAEMPGLYRGKDYDLAGFVVGVVEREQLLPRKDTLHVGDVIIGLSSNGLHSNGFSLVRMLLEQNCISPLDPPPFPSSSTRLIDELLKPTHLYVKPLLPLIRDGLIKAAAHITGGGLLRNLPRVLPHGLVAQLDALSWDCPPIIKWLAQLGNIHVDQALKTWNVGIGLALIVDPLHIDQVLTRLLRSNTPFSAFPIGKLCTALGPPFCSVSNAHSLLD